MRAALAALLLTVASIAAAGEPSEPMLVHSDLPLWSQLDPKAQPRAFADSDSIGQTSEIETGDWWVKPAGDCEDCETWLRLKIAGVMHGGYWISSDDHRAGLGHAREFSIAIALGQATYRSQTGALYLFQTGTAPGSTYFAGFAPDVRDAPVRRLARLDLRCSDGGRIRQAPINMSSRRTAYCAVTRQHQLKAMVQAALKRAPTATMEWIGEPPAEAAP